jgi:hypothetical protein
MTDVVAVLVGFVVVVVVLLPVIVVYEVIVIIVAVVVDVVEIVAAVVGGVFRSKVFGARSHAIIAPKKRPQKPPGSMFFIFQNNFYINKNLLAMFFRLPLTFSKKLFQTLIVINIKYKKTIYSLF